MKGDITSESAIYEFLCSSFDTPPKTCFDSLSEWIKFKESKIMLTH